VEYLVEYNVQYGDLAITNGNVIIVSEEKNRNKKLIKKGIAIDILGIIVIGIAGVLILLLFVQGPLSSLLKGTFCYFYQNVLQQKSEFCKKPLDQPEYVTMSTDTQEELARNIAAYSIICWKNVAPTIRKDIVCYNLLLDKHPGKVTETLMTQIMEREGGCSELENSAVLTEGGASIPYSGNCGTNDQIVWDVSDSVILDQSIVLIKYDMNLGKIVVKS
jgi:hypothetical protein